MDDISPTTASINQFSFKTARRQDVNVAGSDSIPAQKCVRDKKWCHISRRQSSNSMRYGWMRVSGVAMTRLRKSSREIPTNKTYIWVEVKWEANRLYLSPFQRFGMPVVWRIRTRCFPSTSPCIAAYSIASQHTRLSLQGGLSLLVYILQLGLKAAFRPRQLLTQDILASHAFVWK